MTDKISKILKQPIKVKMTELQQIFRIIDDKPYYELKYKKAGEDYYHVGYSSFDFHNVLKWKEEYFELVKENYKETIKKLRSPELPDGLVMVVLETRQEAIKALEKQIPKKPIDKTKPDDTASLAYENCNIIVCPTCGGRLKLKSKGKYCDKCGQKIDWGEE